MGRVSSWCGPGPPEGPGGGARQETPGRHHRAGPPPACEGAMGDSPEFSRVGGEVGGFWAIWEGFFGGGGPPFSGGGGGERGTNPL